MDGFEKRILWIKSETGNRATRPRRAKFLLELRHLGEGTSQQGVFGEN